MERKQIMNGPLNSITAILHTRCLFANCMLCKRGINNYALFDAYDSQVQKLNKYSVFASFLLHFVGTMRNTRVNAIFVFKLCIVWFLNHKKNHSRGSQLSQEEASDQSSHRKNVLTLHIVSRLKPCSVSGTNANCCCSGAKKWFMCHSFDERWIICIYE